MAFGLTNPFKSRQPGNIAAPIAAPPQQPQPSTTQQGPNTGPLTGQGQAAGTTGIRQVQHGELTLVTFSPEELLRQVEEQRSRVSFDLSGTARFMDTFN